MTRRFDVQGFLAEHRVKPPLANHLHVQVDLIERLDVLAPMEKKAQIETDLRVQGFKIIKSEPSKVNPDLLNIVAEWNINSY